MANQFKKAIDWLNSQKKDFNEGLYILQASGFKPGVVRKLARHGVDGPSAMERLIFQMREYAKTYGTPQEVPDTDPELHVFEGQEANADESEKTKVHVMEKAEAMEKGELEVTGTAREVIHNYAVAYKDREICMRKLREMGETNDEETMKRRKELSDIIEKRTNEMEKLYPLFVKFESGEAVSDEELENAMKEEEKTDEGKKEGQEDGKKESSFEGKSREELLLLKKNATSRIVRAQNKLQYQNEAKQDKPNPMPEGPKKVQLEKKIEKEKKLIEELDMAIAQFG